MSQGQSNELHHSPENAEMPLLRHPDSELLPPDDDLFGSESPWTIAHADEIAAAEEHQIAIEGLTRKYENIYFNSSLAERHRDSLEYFLRVGLRKPGEPYPTILSESGSKHPKVPGQQPLEFDAAAEYDPANSEVKVVVFDSDDTLVHTGSEWLESHQTVFRKYNIHLTDQEILDKCFGDVMCAKTKVGIDKFVQAAPDKFKDAQGNQLSDDEIARIVFQEITDDVMPKLTELKLDPELVAEARKLHAKGVRFAVISNSPREILEVVYEKNGVSDLFDIVLAAEDTFDENGIKRSKPDTYTGDKILEYYGKEFRLDGPLPAQHVVVAGDAIDKDVALGKNLGAHSVHLVHPLHRDIQNRKYHNETEELVKAFRTANTHDERTVAFGALQARRRRHMPTKRIPAYDKTSLTERGKNAQESLETELYLQDASGLDDSRSNGYFGFTDEEYQRFTERPPTAEQFKNFLAHFDEFQDDIRRHYIDLISNQYDAPNFELSYRTEYDNDRFRRRQDANNSDAA